MKFGNTQGLGFTLGFAFLHIITFFYDVVTFPLYAIVQNPIGRRKRAKHKRAVITAEDVNSITIASIKKPTKFYNELVRENIDTMAKVLEYCSKKFGGKRCLGTRDILEEIDEVQPNGKIFKKYVMGNYKWRSYQKADEEATYFGRGLREIGVHPGDNVVVFAETRAEWMIAAHGLFKQNFPLVTIYATLGDDGIIHAINETEVCTVITSAELLPKFKSILLKTPKVQRIVYMDDQLKKFENADKISDLVKLYSYNEVVTKGTLSETVTLSPTPDDTAIIMYTSGSTGVPKGVILSHKNLIATLKGFCNSTDMAKNDVMLGFLPLAHVFELLVENVVIFMGIRIGYSTPLTMLDSSSKIKRGSKGDATVLKPTFLTSVPLIMDRIAAAIKDKVTKGSFFVRLLFNFGYNYKVKWTKRGFSTPIVNRIIFGQVRKIVGGKVRLIIAGGAPLSPETHELVKTTLCTLLLQGYGLTESTSSTAVQDVYDDTYGRVGPPMTVIDMRLVNWEEGNYTVKDKPYPRGEIVLGGDNISMGYYKMPEKTNEDFFEENNKRWFKTGDIGEIHTDGVLKIIDRKKDIVKLQTGEYLSLGKIESLLKTNPLVENICIYADSTQNYCIGLIAPQRDNILGLAEQNGITKTFEDLCEDETLTKIVLNELKVYGQKVKLNKFEVPAAIKLVKEAWTAESGFITTTFKLKRKEIQEFYKHDIKKMYSGAS